MIDHEPEHEGQRQKTAEHATRAAYQSIHRRLDLIRQTEALRDKRAMKRTGIKNPIKIYPSYPSLMARTATYSITLNITHPATHTVASHLNPLIDKAMDRLWKVGSIDGTGRADTELRRTYHLVAIGHAPLTQADVIQLGQISETELRVLLPWLAHRMSLAEARDCVARNRVAPPVVTEETTAVTEETILTKKTM